MQDMEFQSNDLGKIQIADEVIQVIAGIAASDVDGVVELSSGGFTENLLGRKHPSRGVKVTFADEDKSCTIDLSVVLGFGVNIPDVSLRIQESVKQAVEGMTGLDVMQVNVHVSAIAFQTDKQKDPVEAVVDKRTR
ncbi:alkaline-shock protein [Alicyclobacillus contaminans]|uniref:Asp23/Gls24 family envelope stress response protein n=1 Tax=Alicyclobacillus contaminans TaxID=392016 RepID=UPI0004079E35|nr:Asp23/Gls24 family envelope stress response protein [Alicyclobacillus contaminans]GMA52399.1 alkaline-shock protein [Alicyclobacillus contaminans]